MRTAPQARGERGQVLSSVVAVAAVVAVVIGLLVLFGTGGPSGGSADKSSGTTTSSPANTTAPVSTVPATMPTSVPTSVPTTTPNPSVAPPRTTEPTQPAPPPQQSQPPQTSDRPTATGPRPVIEVYNNTTRRGLADRVSRRAENAGWRVAGIDNWRGKVVTTTVYYPAGMRDHATALASDLGVGRVKEALDNMKTDRLTVILTSDYSG